MRITWSPQFGASAVAYECAGETLIVSIGDEEPEVFDFSALDEGEALAHDEIDCDYIVGRVRRIDGVIHLTLICPYIAASGTHVESPSPLDVTSDGPIPLPEIGGEA